MTTTLDRPLPIADAPTGSTVPHHIRRFGVQLLVLVACIATAFPVFWMVASSLKTPQESLASPPVWFPRSPNLDSYREVNQAISVGQGFLNSAIIAVSCTIGVVITSLLAGYVFAKKRFRGRNLLFAVLVATMFLPPIVTLIPLYRIAGELDLQGSMLGIILPNLANAFGIFLLRQFAAGVPDELLEAARLDGCSELRIVFRVVAPLLMPAISALTLFAFVYYWQSYLWPLTVLAGDTKHAPIVVTLSQLLSYTGSAQNTGLVMAGACLAVLPPILLFVVLQKQFINSMVSSGIVG